MDASKFVDVCDESFGRFWKILQVDYGLKQLSGKGLVDFYYSLNPKVHLRREGHHGLDYFTREEVIMQLNLPHNKTKFAAAFQVLTEYVEQKRKKELADRVRAEQERKERPSAFASFPRGSEHSRWRSHRGRKSLFPYESIERRLEKKGDPSGSESDTDVYTDCEDEQLEGADAGGSKKRKKLGRPAGQNLNSHNFAIFWEIVSKTRGLRTLEGNTTSPVLYCLEPGNEDRSKAYSKNMAIKILNKSKDKYKVEFARFLKRGRARSRPKNAGKWKRKKCAPGARGSSSSTHQKGVDKPVSPTKASAPPNAQTPTRTHIKEEVVNSREQKHLEPQKQVQMQVQVQEDNIGSSEASSSSPGENTLSAVAKQTDSSVQAFVKEVYDMQQRRVAEIRKRRKDLGEEISRLEKRIEQAKTQRAALKVEELKLRTAKFVVG